MVGAALTGHLQKCGREACEKKAVSKSGKPLYGAAKDSTVKKCIEEAEAS
jgi:hypothetical protein